MSGPDYQKKEAKQSLWDMDGEHIPKRYRNKGKGRGKDKQLIRSIAADLLKDPELDQQDMINAEADEASYCYKFGPCKRCQCEQD